MQVDWRGLLNSLRIPWADRGSNCSRGNVNIACPFCHSDPSHHLAIAEQREAFYCYREPNRHSGTDFIRLLVRLGLPRYDAVRLLNQYKADRPIPPPDSRKNPAPNTRAWDRFAPASENQQCLDYLAGRDFSSPRTLCERFDLRFAKEGSWAKRLLIPMHRGADLISWTGRDLSGRSELKYKTYEVADYQPIYFPDRRKQIREAEEQVFVLVEGPLDALRVADSCRMAPIKVAALCGKHLGPQKLLALREAAKSADILVALDADVALSSCYQMIAELAGSLRSRYIGRAALPMGCKDPGEIPNEGVMKWLGECISRMRRSDIDRRVYK
jgi:hypothetical protein